MSEAADERMRHIAETYPGPQGEQGERGRRGRRGPESARRLPSVAYLFVLNLVLIGAAYLFISHAVTQQQHRWCATLDLLTAHPVPRPADPAANPSRENAYIFYADISDLRGQFGCE